MDKILFGLGFWGIAVFALIADHHTKKMRASRDQKAEAIVGPFVTFMMIGNCFGLA
jgi:hypothetical protein